MKTDWINIALASDDNYAQHVSVVMASVLLNTKHRNRIRFFLLSDTIDNNKIMLLQETVSSLGAKLVIININNCEFNNVYLSGHVSKAAYFRLKLADILPFDVHKIIYLDVDLLVFEDIVEVWETNIYNKPIAAVPDYGIMASARLMKEKATVIGFGEEDVYFNSGVLIIDVDQWREKAFAQQVLHLVETTQLPHHDQDALNKVFINNWYALPLKWNVIPPVFCLFTKILFSSKFRQAAIIAKKNPAIFHYAGRYKPWEFGKKNGFNDKYYDYLRETAFKDVKMPQPGKNMHGKSLLRQTLRIKLADIWCKIFG